MIRIDIRRVKAEEEGTLRAWMAELNRRGAEVSEKARAMNKPIY